MGMVTRTLYALVAFPMPFLALLFLSSWFDYAPSRTGADFLSMQLWALVAVLGLLLPSLRTHWRKWRGDELLPRLRDRRGPAVIVTAAIVLAIAVIVFIFVVPRESLTLELGVSPLLAQLWKLVMALFAVALLVGELVLARRDT